MHNVYVSFKYNARTDLWAYATLSNFISSASDRKRRRKKKIKQLYNTIQLFKM